MDSFQERHARKISDAVYDRVKGVRREGQIWRAVDWRVVELSHTSLNKPQHKSTSVKVYEFTLV